MATSWTAMDSIAELVCSNDQERLRCAPPHGASRDALWLEAPRAGAPGMRDGHLDHVGILCLANCPASTGTRRERSASLRDGLRPSLRDGLRPLPTNPAESRRIRCGYRRMAQSQVSSVRLIAASSRLQRIRVSSSRCRAEGTREYARVAIRLTEVPSRHTAATQNPPHRNPGRPTSNSVIICHGTRTTLNKRRSARPSLLTARCVRMISAASPRPIATARKVTTSRAASESPGAAPGRSPRRNDPASTQPMTPAINGAATARQRLSGEANRILATDKSSHAPRKRRSQRSPPDGQERTSRPVPVACPCERRRSAPCSHSRTSTTGADLRQGSSVGWQP
jgi:hypothetical protein